MFLTHCVTAGIVLTVLSLCRPAWSAVKIIQPYRVVSTNGTAQVHCVVHPRPPYHQTQPLSDHTRPYPYPDPKEVRVTLLKGLYGTQEFCSSFLNFTGQREPGAEQEGDVQCSAQVREGAVEVTVSGLKATDTDLYRCEIEVFYPPPYLQLTGNGTLIHVLGSSDCPVPGAQRQIGHQGEDGEDDEGDERIAPASIPVVVLVILVVFVLLIIIYFQALQCERGRREIFRPVSGA